MYLWDVGPIGSSWHEFRKSEMFYNGKCIRPSTPQKHIRCSHSEFIFSSNLRFSIRTFREWRTRCKRVWIWILCNAEKLPAVKFSIHGKEVWGRTSSFWPCRYFASWTLSASCLERRTTRKQLCMKVTSRPVVDEAHPCSIESTVCLCFFFCNRVMSHHSGSRFLYCV